MIRNLYIINNYNIEKQYKMWIILILVCTCPNRLINMLNFSTTCNMIHVVELCNALTFVCYYEM